VRRPGPLGARRGGALPRAPRPRAQVIDPALDADEYPLRYTEIYDEFKSLYEGLLEKYIESEGSSVAAFYAELRDATERDPDGPEALTGQIMLATTDFDVFMLMMREQRRTLDAAGDHK